MFIKLVSLVLVKDKELNLFILNAGTAFKKPLFVFFKITFLLNTKKLFDLLKILKFKELDETKRSLNALKRAKKFLDKIIFLKIKKNNLFRLFLFLALDAAKLCASSSNFFCENKNLYLLVK